MEAADLSFALFILFGSALLPSIAWEKLCGPLVLAADIVQELLKRLESKLNRLSRKASDLKVRGWAISVFLLFAAMSAGGVVDARKLISPILLLLPLWVLLVITAIRPGFDLGMAIYRSLTAGDRSKAISLLAPVLPFDPASLDDSSLIRSTMALLTARFAFGFALILAYALMGCAGVLMLLFLHSFQPDQEDSGAPFWKGASALHCFFFFIPHLLGAGFLMLSRPFLPFKKPSATGFSKELKTLSYREAPLLAMAYACGISLRMADGDPKQQPSPWLAQQFSAQATAEDLKHSLWIFGFGWVAVFLLLAGLLLLTSHI